MIIWSNQKKIELIGRKIMENNQRWVPWVAVIACAAGQYLSSNILIFVMVICVLGLLMFFMCHIKDNVPLIVVWVFGGVILSGISGITAEILNFSSETKVYFICIPLTIFFLGAGFISWENCREMSYKAWIGALCILLLMLID